MGDMVTRMVDEVNLARAINELTNLRMNKGELPAWIYDSEEALLERTIENLKGRLYGTV